MLSRCVCENAELFVYFARRGLVEKKRDPLKIEVEIQKENKIPHVTLSQEFISFP